MATLATLQTGLGTYKRGLSLTRELPIFRLIRLSARINTPATKLMAADPLGCHAKVKTIAAINRNTFPLRSQI